VDEAEFEEILSKIPERIVQDARVPGSRSLKRARGDI
jgi:hypothetical protein